MAWLAIGAAVAGMLQQQGQQAEGKTAQLEKENQQSLAASEAQAQDRSARGFESTVGGDPTLNLPPSGSYDGYFDLPPNATQADALARFEATQQGQARPDGPSRLGDIPIFETTENAQGAASQPGIQPSPLQAATAFETTENPQGITAQPAAPQGQPVAGQQAPQSSGFDNSLNSASTYLQLGAQANNAFQQERDRANAAILANERSLAQKIGSATAYQPTQPGPRLADYLRY